MSGKKATGQAQARIPRRLAPYFQEYDVRALDTARDANLIIERALEFGNWNEIRWLFRVYGARRIKQYVRESGERNLSLDAFNYWRKMFRLRTWRHSPFDIPRGALWQH